MFCKGAHSYLRGAYKHTHKSGLTNTTHLSPPHTSSASQNVVKVFPDLCQGLLSSQDSNWKQPEGLIIHPTNRPERLKTSPASQKRTYLSKTHHPARVLVPLPLCHFFRSWWTLQSHSCTDGFRGSSVSSLSAQLLREDARNYNQQPVPTPQRSEFITPAPATSPAQVLRLSQCLSCHLPFSLSGFIYEIWKSLSCW